MQFYSTNNPRHRVSFREAVMTGLPPDNGLYMPSEIPALAAAAVRDFPRKSFHDIAFTMAHTLLGESLPEDVLQRIIDEAFTFDAPLVEVEPNLYSLELFHGPTLAFKDFAARFMARLMAYFVQDDHRELTILVATSGDTGSAVANGFFKVPGIRVIVLYPSGKVSHIQEQQLTTLGHNITALEVAGAFDDCQQLVKQAFLDPDLSARFRLTSANSINIARLIPQSFYFAYARSRLPDHGQPAVFSVPSGNFGNLSAGLIAKRMGVPIRHFIAATNANDAVPQFLKSGAFHPRPTVHTISNAMDVGNPSNFVRMRALYDGDLAAMRRDVWGVSFTDDQTRTAMKDIYAATGYTLDPHGAVGFLGLKDFLRQHPAISQGVFLETAHPVKFLDVVEPVLQVRPKIPSRLSSALNRPKMAQMMSSHFDEFKAFLWEALNPNRS